MGREEAGEVSSILTQIQERDSASVNTCCDMTNEVDKKMKANEAAMRSLLQLQIRALFLKEYKMFGVDGEQSLCVCAQASEGV